MSGADKSPRAYTHYRDLVREENKKPVALCKETDLTDAELWWAALTPLESWVFSIDPSLLHALVLAYVRYQDMIGCTDLAFGEFRAEDRAAFPECFHGDCVFSMEGAVGFMVEACEMPFEQALMWVCRAEVQNVRSGLFEASREAPGWARADVKQYGLYPDPDSWTLVNARGYW